MTMTSELTTERLVLRQWRDEDLDVWAAMNADAQVREYFPEVLTVPAGPLRHSVLYRIGRPGS
jgi:RimJ/RimL family protein N-acetyltransferase